MTWRELAAISCHLRQLLHSPVPLAGMAPRLNFRLLCSATRVGLKSVQDPPGLAESCVPVFECLCPAFGTTKRIQTKRTRAKISSRKMTATPRLRQTLQRWVKSESSSDIFLCAGNFRSDRGERLIAEAVCVWHVYGNLA